MSPTEHSTPRRPSRLLTAYAKAEDRARRERGVETVQPVVVTTETPARSLIRKRAGRPFGSLILAMAGAALATLGGWPSSGSLPRPPAAPAWIADAQPRLAPLEVPEIPPQVLAATVANREAMLSSSL